MAQAHDAHSCHSQKRERAKKKNPNQMMMIKKEAEKTYTHTLARTTGRMDEEVNIFVKRKIE